VSIDICHLPAILADSFFAVLCAGRQHAPKTTTSITESSVFIFPPRDFVEARFSRGSHLDGKAFGEAPQRKKFKRESIPLSAEFRAVSERLYRARIARKRARAGGAACAPGFFHALGLRLN
jgi:hypothetical protein